MENYNYRPHIDNKVVYYSIPAVKLFVFTLSRVYIVYLYKKNYSFQAKLIGLEKTIYSPLNKKYL